MHQLLRGLIVLTMIVSLPADARTRNEVMRWAKDLNPGGDAPVGSFKAFYFGRAEMKSAVSAKVPDISVNYTRDSFHGIPAGDFRGYWVGWMEFKQDEQRLLKVHQSHAITSVFINGKVAFHEDSSGRSVAGDSQLIRFPKGR